ncbi:MAG: hypothetical protein S4CHLAM2_03540 [Chlamydiales bacterium]|nr:hypothetical protein [Chlamydiales bacterium]
MTSASSSASEYSTTRDYYFDTYKSSVDSTILSNGKDDTGTYFVPNKTVFHPQGGGQPSDKGTARIGDCTFDVTHLKEVEKEIRHYVDSDGADALTGTVFLTVDIAKRTLFARLHSGGHLLSSVVGELYPALQGYKGNHFPDGQAFVVFKGKPLPDKTELQSAVEKRVAELIESRTQMIVDNDNSPRSVHFEGLETYPCGGTHVRNASEIIGITIRNVKAKKGELRIGYDVVAQEESGAAGAAAAANSKVDTESK